MGSVNKSGFIPWQDYDEASRRYFSSPPVIFDKDNPRDIEGAKGYPVVCQYLVTSEDKQFFTTYDSFVPGINNLRVSVVFFSEDDDETPPAYVDVSVGQEEIVISNGIWEIMP